MANTNKDRADMGDEVAGRAKEAWGKVTGDERLEQEGRSQHKADDPDRGTGTGTGTGTVGDRDRAYDRDGEEILDVNDTSGTGRRGDDRLDDLAGGTRR
jgi:hypothetical protein